MERPSLGTLGRVTNLRGLQIPVSDRSGPEDAPDRPAAVAVYLWVWLITGINRVTQTLTQRLLALLPIYWSDSPSHGP
jgi:hypothetical protein